MNNLGIYLQVPFCASKCSFCNFSSRVERDTIFDQYTQAVRGELVDWQRFASDCGIDGGLLNRAVDSVYAGGGTPTLLGAERLDCLLRGLHEHLRWTDDVEFTLETTPGTATVRLLGALRGWGVNRLSIGAQTFDDDELRSVGRLHSAEDAISLVELARKAGFRNISLDLIAGLPFQTKDSFRRSLEIAVNLRPEHLSLYLFEIDEKSRLGREVVNGGARYHAATVPDEEFMATAYETACAFLSSEGYRQYEISNFSLPGCESRHNRKYWQVAPYIGLGAGAHSFDGLHRWSNHSDVQTYLGKLQANLAPLEECRTLTVEEQVEEFFFLGLRQVNGVDLRIAREQWAADQLGAWEQKIRNLAADGWLICEGDSVRLAPHAYLVSNEIFQEFVCV